MSDLMNEDRSFTFARDDTPQEYINMMFGPLDGDTIIPFTKDDKLEDLAVTAGLFPSKSEAKKNGWSGELKGGLNNKALKKRKIELWYFKPNEYTFQKPCECCEVIWSCK